MKTRDSSQFHIILVKGWIEKNGQFLLAKRHSRAPSLPGVWSLPGGKVEDTAETVRVIEQTLKREIKEEVGVTIADDVKLIYNNSFNSQDGTHVVSLTFLCRYQSGQARALDGTAEVKWLTLKELKNFSPAEDFLRQEIAALANYFKAIA